jgi:hypothetical protein
MRRNLKDPRLAVIGLSILLAASCAAQDGASPSRTAEEAAQELARLSVELGSLDSALDRAADWTWGASLDSIVLALGREPTEDEQVRGLAVLREVIGEFVTPELWEQSVTRVYGEQFTAAELNEMVRFYGSPVGRKVLSLENQLTDEVDDLIGEALAGDPLESFIARVDEALGAELGLGGGEGS